MKKFKRQFLASPYGQTHYRVKRSEPSSKRPLVCLHMFPQSGRSFEEFLNYYPDDRTVVVPDFPGYGESDAPPEQIDATAYAESIWHSVDALGLLDEFGSIDLFGIHAGAKMATEVARLRPDQVNHIVLSSAALLYEEELAHLKNAFDPVPLDKAGTRLMRLWDLVVRNQGKGQTLEMLATSLAEILRGGENYEWGHYAVYEFNKRFPEVLASLSHPIALMNPKDDLYEMTARSEQYLNNGRLYDFPDWDLSFMQVHAAAAARTISQLLDDPLNFNTHATQEN